MVPRSERRTRGWPLTKRLALALSVGSFFVALFCGFLGADRDEHRRAVAAAEQEQVLAVSLAERAAPLLDRGDLMRLSVLSAVVRVQLDGRAVVLDRDGRVLLDTELVLGERKLGLLAASGPFQRSTTTADVTQRETLAPLRFGGEVVGEVRLTRVVAPQLGSFDFVWFGLVFLCCLSLVTVATMLGHHWSTRVRGATDAVIRLAAGEVAGAPAEGHESELQDLSSALRELERGMHEGLQRVGEGYAAMALQVVDGLERRRLIPPEHGERTARLAGRLAERLQLLPADRNELELACRLVDLGKAWVRAPLLQKQAPLTEIEAQSLHSHPQRAADQLDCVPGLRRVAKIVRHQLERYDGRGLPDSLRGERIPLGSRILAIAAAFDLLTTCNGERPATWEEALELLAKERGEVFDPWLVDVFAEEIRKAPPAVDADREVMIVPGGALPWRTATANAASDDDEDEDELGGAELEVLLDDTKREDQA